MPAQKSKFHSKTQHQFNVTIENYIKAIWNLSQSLPKNRKGIKNIDLSKHLNVTRASITGMVKKLLEKGLISKHETGSEIYLSPKGLELAYDILRKHRLIEMFLLRTLDMEGLEIHEEAELLEHAISPKLLDAIDAFLEFPKYDDSGLTIPRTLGRKHIDHTKDSIPLSSANIKDTITVVSIADYDPTSLDGVRSKNIQIGARFKVVDVSHENFIHLQSNKKQNVVLSFDEANLIRVATP